MLIQLRALDADGVGTAASFTTRAAAGDVVDFGARKKLAKAGHAELLLLRLQLELLVPEYDYRPGSVLLNVAIFGAGSTKSSFPVEEVLL